MSNEEIIKRIILMFEKCSSIDECEDYDCEKCKAAQETIIQNLSDK